MKKHVTYHQSVPSSWQLIGELTPTNSVSFLAPCVKMDSYKAAKLVESWNEPASADDVAAFERLTKDVDESRHSERKIFSSD